MDDVDGQGDGRIGYYGSCGVGACVSYHDTVTRNVFNRIGGSMVSSVVGPLMVVTVIIAWSVADNDGVRAKHAKSINQ